MKKTRQTLVEVHVNLVHLRVISSFCLISSQCPSLEVLRWITLCSKGGGKQVLWPITQVPEDLVWPAVDLVNTSRKLKRTV